MHKSGFVNIIGKPNVGKSSIFNMILNLKDDGKILILDIPDRAKEKFYKRNVEKAMGKINYKKKYSSHSHLFYEKNFFKKLAKEYKLKIKIYKCTKSTIL